MNSSTSPHPSSEELAAFDCGGLSAAARVAVEKHIARCKSCCHALEGLPEDTLVALLRAYATVSATIPVENVQWNIPAALVGHPRYRVLGVLGRGGMGTVYKAIQRHTDRVVALKVLAESLQIRPDFVERFRREARAIARLQHPNIVLAYDADQAGDLHFLVMEYVEGTSLDRLLEQEGTLAVGAAADYIRQTALGLQHAHEQGLIHRDIKPANLLLTTTGQVKIADFGLARLVSAECGPATPLSASPLLGTLDYLAPEQARDPADVDRRADIYSLGCTFYHLLTGQPPFPRGTPLQKLLGHQERSPRPATELRPDMPARLAALLERTLAKQPERRPATAAEVAEEISVALSAEGTAPSASRAVGAARRRSRRALAVLVAAAVLLATVSVAALVGWRPTRPPDENERVPVQGETRPAAALAGPEEVADRRRASRDLALAWVRENNRWGPGASIVANTTKVIDANLARSDGFELGLGPQLVKSEKLTIVVGRLGELFVFEPTPDEARAYGVRGNARSFFQYRKGDDLRRVKPRMIISGLRLVPSGDRLIGKMSYRLLEPVGEKLHVRMTYYPYVGRQRTIRMFYLRQPLAGDGGEVAFDFKGINEPSTRDNGLVVVFIELASRLDDNELIESNTLATLLRPADGRNPP
jgi:hypothetical protein